MNESLKRVVKRWLYIVIISFVVVIVGHHAMTYIVAALTALKSVCDWGMDVLLNSPSGFLMYAIIVFAILIYIEKQRQKKAPESEKEEATSKQTRESGRGVISSIKKAVLKALRSFLNKAADEEKVEKAKPPAEKAEATDYSEEAEAEKSDGKVTVPTTVKEADQTAKPSKIEVEDDLF